MLSARIFSSRDLLGRQLAAHDWSSSVLGDPQRWPAAVRSAVRLMVGSRYPVFMAWGVELGLLYNQAYVELLDGKHPWAIGRPFRTVWPELWPELAPLIERTLGGEAIYLEDVPFTMQRNGRAEQTWFSFSYTPLTDDDGAILGVYGTCDETTGRVTTERRLAFQLRMADQLRGLSKADEIVRRATQLLGTELRAGRVLFAEVEDDGRRGIFHSNYIDNAAAEPMAGLQGAFDSALFGRSLVARLCSGHTSVHHDIEAELGATEAQAAHTFLALGIRAEISVPILRSGELSSILIVNHPVPRRWTRYEIELVEDVAERTWNAVERARAEASLRQAKLKLEELLGERTAERDRLWEMAQDVLAVASTDGYFVSCNPALSATLGWSERELCAMPFASLAHPEQIEELADIVARLRAGQSVTRYEIRSRHRDGSYRWLSWNIVPRGRLLYMAGRDVTEERQHQEALRQAEDALRQAQKMEAVGQLTGGIAHDFNNMLGGIVGNLQMARIHLGAGRAANLGRYLDGAEKAAHRAATLTHRLLAFSRRQMLDPQPIDVNALILSLHELIARTVGPSIQVEMEAGSAHRIICCDANQLENALLNLAINARDAMPDGGRLLVRTIDIPAPARRIRISVADNGGGMTPDVAARAFEPFYTTKGPGQGTGLGLSMVFGFVSQSGGEVHIESAPGRGTTVVIDLPQYTGAAARAPHEQQQAQERPPAIRPSANQASILLVDDEASLREVLVELLEGAGHVVAQAADGAAALGLLRQTGRIDLVITDVGLPGGMDGRQLADAIRAERPGIDVLFISGYAESMVLSKGALGPGMQLMTKPFTLDAFAARVAAIFSPYSAGPPPPH
jgi:PAS domain S-box-containing protein